MEYRRRGHFWWGGLGLRKSALVWGNAFRPLAFNCFGSPGVVPLGSKQQSLLAVGITGCFLRGPEAFVGSQTHSEEIPTRQLSCQPEARGLTRVSCAALPDVAGLQ